MAQPAKLLQGMRLLAIALLVLGVAGRFAHLDRKVYWHDEAYTSAVITARPGRYYTDSLFQNTRVKPADLLAYQRFVPGLTLVDMVVRKGTEDVQHPPVYYVLLRFWTQIWGTDPAVIRGFSALLSLLLFPAVYGLCWELFESRLSGWVAIALFAVSPLHLVFAQEAREFEIWAIASLASSALLLRAMRFPSWRNWVGYGVAMVVAFYTGLFSLGVAVGHGAYGLVVDEDNRLLQRPWRLGSRTLRLGLTLVLVGVLFIPWAYFMITAQKTLSDTTSWTAQALPVLLWMQMFTFNFSRSFVDFNSALSDGWIYGLALPLLVLQGYALYVVCQTAPKRVGWFLLTFIGSTALFFGLPDLLFGGMRFTVTRYLFPCFIGLHLAVVYLLSHYLVSMQRWKVRFAALMFGVLIGLGIVSSGVYTQAQTWWNKGMSVHYHDVAERVNGSDRPLIITDSYSYNPFSILALSYLLKPDTQLLLLPPVGTSFVVEALPEAVQTVFLFNLPEVFRQQFEAWAQREVTLVFKDDWNELWQATIPALYLREEEQVPRILPAGK